MTSEVVVAWEWLRILVAIDGSTHSLLALDSAIALALRANAELTVLGVSPRTHVTAAAAWGVAIDAAELQEQTDAAMANAVDRAVARVPSDVKVVKRVRRGNPGREIVAQIVDGQHDIVVLGSRGLGRVGGLIGSVSQHVLHHAGIAVVVLHAPDPSP
jgi:nucleotide-binding universal stress UspA family protein